MNKKGFSIPELLIVMVIISVISVAFITTVKPMDKYMDKLYYKAYDILSTAAYNVKADVEDHNTEVNMEAQARGEEPNPANLISFPDTSEKLCEKLAGKEDGYINVGGSLKCTNTVDFDSINQFDNKSAAELKDSATFITSNGMRFYFAPKKEVEYRRGSTKYKITYFPVWVDLNGGRKPNSAVWNTKRLADIVPFLIASDGSVIPAGAPTYDYRYLKARVVHASPDYPEDSDPLPYVAARIKAYNVAFALLPYTYVLDPMSWQDPLWSSIPTEAKNLVQKNNLYKYAECPRRGSSVLFTSPVPPHYAVMGYGSCSVKVEPRK